MSSEHSKYSTNGQKKDRYNKNSKKKFQPNFTKKIPVWKQIDEEISQLAPLYEEIDSSKIESFDDFPLSKRTKDGLKKANYNKPTEIQRESIGIALKGYDLLGAAKTGSGKTLAFLIPILETLYSSKWSKLDGLGVLVISPTRELAYQTFEVLKKIGRFHDFSAGLVIGGKDLKTESKIINQTNIIICTPGRLLQHMDETVGFSCDNLKILVLDEADRILDLGFAETMNAIIENLPQSRQTMLFSATQTKSIKDLARLSLKNPTYVSVHENSAVSTPQNLVQNYVVCDTHDKISFLWSFIRNHLNQKIIVFFQSCKQVKYVYEALTRLQTGMTTLALYGTMNQLKRMEIYDQYVRKVSAVLFATDIAARGLDFPSINWVVQMDCPPDVNTYIHRVGRTARYEKDGQGILVLTPFEETEMINDLQAKKIPITKIEVNMKRIENIDSKLQSMCASDVELKESAKRALKAYMRSIYLMSNKQIFNIENIDLVKFSSSLGLVVAPKIRLAKNQNKTSNKEISIIKMKDSQGEEDTEDASGAETEKTKLVKKLRDNKLVIKKVKQPLNFAEFTQNDEEAGSLFTVKKNVNISTDSEDTPDDTQISKKVKVKSKASVAKRLKKKNIKINEKVLFDEDGNRIADGINVPKSVNLTDQLADELDKKSDQAEYSGINIEEARKMLQNEDVYDKQLYRQRVKRDHREKRFKEKEARRAKRQRSDNLSEAPVLLGANSDNESDE
ncbi:putative ATP-dependent RNA helicase DDX10 [Brachionus plicatilis]|uniref:ATP-dependent RNA helicase n=1 Tax=Brachionus plicatilis TaxID=10195 RepID=A0A3M7SLN3_BRAPC|nr:putative ATP-dependent RNA helicase DDX10 [Brachionus plicatilis]